VRILATTLGELRTFNRPAILMVVKKGRRRHVVTLLWMTDDKLVIGDPGGDDSEVNLDEFRARYRWDGRALVAWRDSAFVRRSNEPPEPRLHP